MEEEGRGERGEEGRGRRVGGDRGGGDRDVSRHEEGQPTQKNNQSEK